MTELLDHATGLREAACKGWVLAFEIRADVKIPIASDRAGATGPSTGRSPPHPATLRTNGPLRVATTVCSYCTVRARGRL